MQKRHHSFDDFDDDNARGSSHRGSDRRSLVESSGPRTSGGAIDFAGCNRGNYRNVQLEATPRCISGGEGGSDRSLFKAGPPAIEREPDHGHDGRLEEEVMATTHGALTLFSVLGMGTLFPYNALVTCADYFEFLYPDVAAEGGGGGGGAIAGRLATSSIVSLFLTTVLLLPLTTMTVDGNNERGRGDGRGGGRAVGRRSSEGSIHGIAMTESRNKRDVRVVATSDGDVDIDGGAAGDAIRESSGDDSSPFRCCSSATSSSSLLHGLRTDPTRRIAAGYATVASVLLAFATTSDRLPLPGALALAFLIGAGDAVSQSQLYVYAASIDARCTAAVAFGSAAAGLVVSLLRLATKAVFDGAGGASSDAGVGMRRDGAAFFGASSLVLVGCLVALRVAVRMEGRIRLAFAVGNGGGHRGVGDGVPMSECEGGGGGGSDESTAFSSSSASPSNSPPRMTSSSSSPFAKEAFHLASNCSNDSVDAAGVRGDSSTPCHETPRGPRKTNSEVELLPASWNVAFRRRDEDWTGGERIAGNHLASEDTGTRAPLGHVGFQGDEAPPHATTMTTTTTTTGYSALPPLVGSGTWRWARMLPLHPVYQETLAVSWRPTLATFFNSFVTLSLFPGTVTSMRSIDDDGTNLGSSWLPVLLVFAYNLFDCVGRGSLAFKPVADLVRYPLGRTIYDPAHRGASATCEGDAPRATWGAVVGYELPRFVALVGIPCAARVVFFPAVALCVVPRPTPWIRSYWARCAVVSSFALSNGYVNAACFVAGPTMMAPRAHRDSSSLVLLLAGFSGLVAGGFFGMFLDRLLATTTTT